MLKEAFCSFETAKLLDEAGFIPSMDCVITIYNEKGESVGYDDKETEHFYQAPTHQVALSWLRENGYCIEPYAAAYRFGFTISKVPTGSHIANEEDCYPNDEFETYEESVEAAIKYVIKYLMVKCEDDDTFLKKDFPKEMLSDELFNKLKHLNKPQGLKFIRSNSTLGLKESAIYYDLYVKDLKK